MVALPIVMLLVFGAPTFAAMTPMLWVLFGLGQIGNIKGAIKTEKQLYAFVKSPAGRAMAAANGEAAIRWQNRQMEIPLSQWAAANGERAIQLRSGKGTEK